MLYPFPPTRGASSPWGSIQSVTPLGPDAVAVTTASHGGLRISLTAMTRLPKRLQRTAFSEGGWFEEDCDWAIPYLALGLDAHEADPDRGARLRNAARRTIWTYHRDHAALLGVTEDPAQAEGRSDG